MTAALKAEPSPRKPVTLIGQLSIVESGYPVKKAMNLVNTISPKDMAFRKRIFSTATLTRSRAANQDDVRLKKALSEKIARIERIWERVLKIYNHDEVAAREFLFRPHLMLDDRSPIDVALLGETGAVFLNSVLDTIEYNFAA